MTTRIILRKGVYLISLEMGVLGARHEVLAAGEAPRPGLAIGFAGECGVVLLRLVAAVLRAARSQGRLAGNEGKESVRRIRNTSKVRVNYS